jgi:hypothetical protein
MGELMSARLATENVELPQVMVISTLFILLLIDGLTPREAWRIVKAAVEKFDEAERPIFSRLLAYLRSACAKNGSRGGIGELSLMTTTWSAPAANTRTFQSWQIQVLRMLYSSAFEGTTPGGGGGAFPPDFFDGLAGALKAGVNQAAPKYKEVTAASALATEKDSTTTAKWSPLVQELILRCHGLPSSTTWESPEIMPTIWSDYEDASRGTGSTEAKFQRVFMANMPGSASIETGFLKAPVLLRSNAKDIKAGRLGPIARALTYENCDQGLPPLAFMERSNEELVEAGFEDEEYGRWSDASNCGDRKESQQPSEEKTGTHYLHGVGRLAQNIRPRRGDAFFKVLPLIRGRLPAMGKSSGQRTDMAGSHDKLGRGPTMVGHHQSGMALSDQPSVEGRCHISY